MKSLKYQAWRNLSVAAINEGLRQHIFGLGEEENFWIPQLAKDRLPYGFTYSFPFREAFYHCFANVNDCSWGELCIHFAVNPDNIRLKNFSHLPPDLGLDARKNTGCAIAVGRCWFERKTGKWLQTSPGICFSCKSFYKDVFAATHVIPHGFLDHGKFFL